MIKGKNVSLTYDGKPILSAIDFTISNNKKIGIVGQNGCGKTSLFKIINGVEPVSSGAISIENERLAYLPQEFDFPNVLVGEYMESKLENSWDSYKIDMLVEQLKFKKYDEYQKISILSEGQKMKLKLIELLLVNPTTLFIDEPTNHLDIETKEVIEKNLSEYKGNLILVSHDRYFVENVDIQKLLKLEQGKLEHV